MSIIAEHWWLKQMPISTIKTDGTTNDDYTDFVMCRQNLIAVGKQSQLDEFLTKRMIEDGWELKDAWEYPLNDELIEMYNNNNKEIIILNLER